MNQEIKKKWVDALRSGKYKQGRGRLKASGKFCCLGVLCSVVRAKNWVGDALLPSHVRAKAGLDCYNPGVEYHRHQISLAELNDNGTSFAEIAGLIEEQL